MAALGILLIILGLGLVIGEFFTGTHVLVAMGSVLAILGLVFWAMSGTYWFEVNWWAVIILLVVFGALVFWTVFRIRQTSRRQVTTGTEELIGKTAIVQESLNPEGTVVFQGDLWNAVSRSGTVQAGEQVSISGVDGLTLIVVKQEKK